MAVQDIKEALITASMLIGNANAKLTRLRREKLISAINDNLTPLVQDESQFTDVAPYLFGSDFVKQAKEYLDQVGALKSTLTNIEHEEPYDRRPIFCWKTPQSKANVPTGIEEPRDEVIPIPGLNSTHTILSVKMPCQNTNVTHSAIAAMGIIPLRVGWHTFNQTGKSNKGPVGPKYNEGVRNRIFIKTPSNPKTLPCPTKPDPTGVGIPRDQRHDLKRDSDRVTDPTSGRVPLHPVSGAKERWRPETGDKFEKVKLFHKCPTFQDGRHSHTQKPSPKGRLASKDRPERCILFCPDKQRAKEISVFPIQGQILPVQLSPFRPGLSPMGLYQDLKADSSSRSGAGDTVDSHILLIAETEEKARDQASGLIYLLQCLGFTVNMEKTVLDPSQYLEFLGFMVDTTKMELSLPAQKIKKIWAESRQILEVELVTARTLSRLIGKMNATNQVIPPAPLFYRSLQMDLTMALRRADQDYETHLNLSPDSREELIWWDTQMIKWNGRTVLATEPDLTIESDASSISNLWLHRCNHRLTRLSIGIHM